VHRGEANWWTYLYGPDLLVSHIWEKEGRTQQVSLPAGEKWRDAWSPEKIYDEDKPLPSMRICSRYRYLFVGDRTLTWEI